MGPHIALALLMVCSIYLAGRIAERRGRCSKSGRGLLRLSGRSRFHWCSCSRTCMARMATVPRR